MSALAVVVIVIAALLFLATLVVGGRKAAAVRARRHLGPSHDEVHPYRSHAEASRHTSPH
mgnify:CR=1 FL=1